jgi:hypothetical protein
MAPPPPHIPRKISLYTRLFMHKKPGRRETRGERDTKKKKKRIGKKNP